MHPSSTEMQGVAASLNGISASAVVQIALHDLHNVHGLEDFGHSETGCGGHDGFFDQVLSVIPGAWSELEDTSAVAQKLSNVGLSGKSQEDAADGLQYGAPYDESSLLASLLRQHQMNGGGSSPREKQMVLQFNHQQMLLQGVGRTPSGAGGDSGLLPVPLTLGDSGGVREEVDASYKSTNSTGSDSPYNGFMGPILRSAQSHHFHHPQDASMGSQSFGGTPPSAGTGQAPTGTATVSASASAGGGTALPRQRVRARRGQATDPHSIAERLRRERITERMKALQELVPNPNKTDKASMLDEIIDYVKFLQLQVKVLSMSRLGGAAAVAPLVADMSSESGMGHPGMKGGAGGANDSSITVTEHQVAKLMEEDMGSAMQYLQGKGLCLMPISLASAISSASCHPRPPQPSPAAGLLSHGLVSGVRLGPATPDPPSQPSSPSTAAPGGPSSSSLSALTVQPDADTARLSGNKDNTRP